MNKNYLRYLFKSKKSLCVVVGVIYAIIYLSCMMMFNDANLETLESVVGVTIIAAILAYVLVPLVFAYIQNKKAVDSYFSLPVSRKEMLVSNLLFTSILIVVPFIFLTIISLFIILPKATILIVETYLSYALIASVGLICLVIFNTAIFSICNSLFDGITMILAYAFLPVLIAICVSIFLEEFVAGVSPINVTELISYISLPTSLAMALASEISLLENFVSNIELGPVIFRLVICIITHLIASIILLKKNFILRKVERAETISNNFFSYPFIIYAYAFLLVLSLSISTYLISSVTETLILYVVVFICFMIANFVYLRSVKLRIKDVIFFVLTVIISILFSFLALKTKGFTLSECYDHSPINYAFSIESYRVNDDAFSLNEVDTLVFKAFNDYKEYDLNFSFEIPEEDMAKNKDLINFIETKRKEGIKDFYTRNNNYHDYCFLTIQTNYDEDNKDFWGVYNSEDRTNYATYTIKSFLTLADLEFLDRYCDITFDIYDYGMHFNKTVNFKELLQLAN